jgi:predicted flap endonuclease-1-like 5' DNA nuclease
VADERSRQIQTLRAEREQLQSAHESRQATINELENSVRQRDEDIDRLQRLHEEARHELDALQARLSDQERMLRQQEAEHADQNRRLQDELAKFQEESGKLEEQLRVLTGQVAETRSSNAELSEKLAEADEEQLLLTTELRAVRNDADRLRAELARCPDRTSDNDNGRVSELNERYKMAVDRALRAERELADARNELYRQSEAANAWRQERSEMLDRIEQLDRIQKDLEEKLASAQYATDTGADSESAIERRPEGSPNIETELADSQPAPSGRATPSPRAKKPSPVSREQKSSTRHPLLGRVYLQEPKTQDDLRQIRGLGPVLEKRLHALGIYQFSQIEKWNLSIKSEIAKLIGTSDRMIANWVEQAEKFRQSGSD